MSILANALTRVTRQARISTASTEGHTCKYLPSSKGEDLMRTRIVLECALDVEALRPAIVHEQSKKARMELRRYILKHDFRSFLQHSTCRQMFFRS